MRLPIVALATLALLLGAAAAQQAPLRYRAPGEGTAHSDDKATTCRRGYGYNEDDGTCFPCTNGFFSPGGRSRCLACAKRGRSHHFSTPQGAWRASQCVCRPGHGGVDCEPCERNTWSPGGVFGSDDRSQARPFCRPCPANSYGTRKQGADSLFDCGGCVAGYGGLSCEPCPPGTWSPGGSYSPCQKCGPYQSSPPASSSSTFCTCVAGYGTDAVGQCSICPVGTWWPGPPSEASAHAAASVSTVSACLPCSSLDPSGGGGFTTLTQGATSARQCVCKPGHAGQFCRACQAGDVCPGGSTEVLHVCPSNSYARNSSASNSTMTKAECVCKPGTGKPASNNENCADCPICEPCPAGTWAAGGTRDTCSTCPPGTTSPAGSTTKDACKPIVCPDGMQLSEDPNAANAPREITCVCKAGYGGGSDPKAGCQLCPYGTFALGGSLDSCTPCPFGFSSRAGANASSECRPLNVTCPRGQVAPANATSPAECACMPGHGTPGACSNCTSCSLCPVSTWSSGGRLEPCLPCDFNFTSLPGAITKLDCFSSDQCPPGTQLPAGTTGASAADCKCKAGFGSVLVLPPGVTTPFCTQCLAGLYSPGGTLDTCLQCPGNTTSIPGATNITDCTPLPSPAP